MKKLNKLVSIVVAMAMVLALTAITAFADDPTYYTSQPLDVTIETVHDEALPTLTDAITFTTTDEGAAPISTINLTEGSFTKTEGTEKDTWAYNVANVVPAASNYGHAGVYTYTVSQNLETTALVHEGATAHLTAANDKGYTMKVYVVDNHGTLSIQAVTLADETGKLNTSDDGTGNQKSIAFDNDYFETLNDDDDYNDDDDLDNDEYIITKTVADGQGSKSKQFEITAVLTLANLDGQQIKAFIRDKDGNKVEDRTVTITDGTVVGSIAHGEKIVVKGLPIGTAYDTDETDTSVETDTGKYTRTLTNDEGTVTAKGTTTGVLNTMNEETPEGILISNLPYIALALVAVGGLVAYVVVRRKNEDNA